MSKRNASPWLLILFLLVPARLVRGQEIRKMEFALGHAQNELQIEIEYHDPGELDKRLKGSRLLPIKLKVSNIASRPITLDYGDLRMNVGGNQVLPAVDISVVNDEIRRSGRFPRLLGFLASQSSTFHRTDLERRRLQDGKIEPGKSKEGFVFFVRPEAPPATSFNGVLWMEAADYTPQALETKDVNVQTAPAPTTLDRIREIWKAVVSGEFPYKKSYALLVGIGKYKHLPPLSSPVLDVRKMQAFLLSQGFDEIITIEDESVTVDMLKYPQKYFKAKIQPGDRFLFYYSGHGLSVVEGGRPRGYLPLVNTPKDSHAEAVPMDDLVAWMKRLSTEHLLVIMDACFSGLAIEGVETHGVDQLVMNSLASPPARYLMMAGTERQESIADKKWNGSLFTEMIIRGVQTAKFADRMNDRIVATHALYSWVRPNVTAEALKVNRQLTPLLKDLADVSKGEFLFFRK